LSVGVWLAWASEKIVLSKVENTHMVQQLQSLNSDLPVKINDRTQDLASANERLTKLDHIQSAFMLNVSHELRSPVTTLKFNLDLLQRELARANSLSVKSERYIAMLMKQVDLLVRIIEDMLNLLQLEQEASQITLTAVDLNYIIDNVLIEYGSRTNLAGLSLIHEPDASLPLVKGDAERLTQVLKHLLENAITYNAPAGQIRLSVERNGGGYVGLQVTDTGMGIPPADLPYIFDRFYRGADVNESTIAGTGLGLSIVKQIVELHAGKIEVESQIGKGTTFRIWLPVHEGPIARNERSSFAAGIYVLPNAASG